MGLLKLTTPPLNWDETKQLQADIKKYGIMQAINLWKKFKSINMKIDDLNWGDEVEYQIATIDVKEQTARVYAEGFKKVTEDTDSAGHEEYVYQEESGTWMIEAVPIKPYKLYDINAPKQALESLIRRRRFINDALFMNNTFLTSLTSFPNLGVKNWFVTEHSELLDIENYEEHNEVTGSKYILDDFINPHPRFPGMMKNVRDRRGKKVDIRAPLYQDENTGVGKIDGEMTPGEIYMDCQLFGMGICCVQATFETQNIEHAKYLHD